MGAAQGQRNIDLAADLDALGLTQVALARILGVHPNTVSNWMTGKAKLSPPARAYLDFALRMKAAGSED